MGFDKKVLKIQMKIYWIQKRFRKKKARDSVAILLDSNKDSGKNGWILNDSTQFYGKTTLMIPMRFGGILLDS